MLEAVVDLLACPTCAGDLQLTGAALRCVAGHSHDVARHGYVSLLAPGAEIGAGDTAAMIEARVAFLASGHYAPLLDALVQRAVAVLPPRPAIIEVGAGPGAYLAAVVDRVPGARGVALDLSRFAARRAARVRPRVGAVVADGRLPLPVRTGVVDLALSVFAPRNSSELRRVLRPGGTLQVVTPTERHLMEIVGPLGLLTVDTRKQERLEGQLGGLFALADQRECEFVARLAPVDVERLVLMGPSAFHTDPGGLAAGIAALRSPVPVTVSVTISTYRPR